MEHLRHDLDRHALALVEIGQGHQDHPLRAADAESSGPTGQAFNSALLSTAGGSYVAVEMVFIQFAGFTFGKSAGLPGYLLVSTETQHYLR